MKEEMFINNLKLLATRYSQNQIAKDTGVSPASISGYIKGSSEPSVGFLMQLKKAYGYSIDDFLLSKIKLNDEIKKSNSQERFLGNYIMYYYDSTAYKGAVSNYATNTLNYGIISIFYESEFSPKLKVKGNFVNSRKEAEKFLSEANKAKTRVSSMYENFTNGYHGTIEESSNQIFIKMRNESKSDQVFMIFNNPPTIKEYIGGLGTSSSVSRGREQMPCVQYIVMSRWALEIPDGEIYNLLSLGTPTIEVSKETERMIELFKNIYLSKSDFAQMLSDFQKKKIIEDSLSNILSEQIEANIFRFAKVSNMEDDKLYRILRERRYDD